MGKLLAALGALVLASVAATACVGESATPPAQGTLDARCFSNGTCNAGLACVVVNGTATCQPSDAATSDGAPPGDAAASDSSDGGPDAARLVCKSVTTNFSCQNQVSCIVLGQNSLACRTGSCMTGEQAWECYSPKQCTAMACCLSGAAPVGVSASSCTAGTIDVATLTLAGTCKATCAADDTRLCTSNDECGAGTCVPTTVTGGTGTSLKGLGVCVK